MQLAALVDSVDHVCCRYRLRAFEAGLREQGHRFDLHPWPRGWWQRLNLGNLALSADGMLIQRKLPSRLETTILRRRVSRLYFDFDDAVWLRDSYSPKGLHDRRRQRRFRHLLSQCDGVVAGNAFLAEEAGRWARGRPIHIVPTCVDLRQYSSADHDRPPGQATLVWIGSSSTLKGLESIRPLLEHVGENNPAARLKLICDRFFELTKLRVEPCRWSESTEPREIATSDIGISYVPDDDWSRGKCGLKVLQYMAAGLPVIANPVGVHTVIVKHGVTGFLARNAAEWAQFVRTLAGDPDLRRQMGASGRALVAREYSVERGVELWSAFLQGPERKRVPA